MDYFISKPNRNNRKKKFKKFKKENPLDDNKRRRSYKKFLKKQEKLEEDYLFDDINNILGN